MVSKRKIVLSIAVLALLLSAVVGFAQSQNAPASAGPVTIKMMIWGAPADYDAINAGFIKTFSDMAKKVKLEVVVGGSGDADVAQKLRLMLAANGELPNMIRLNYTQLAEFAEAGVLQDLSKYVTPYVDKIIPAALNVMKYNGKFYAFPQEVKTKIWWYRKDIFAECGVDPSKVKTVDDFIAAGKKIQQKYPNKYIENYLPPENAYDLTMLLSGNGGRFCDEKGNYNIASDLKVKAAFETLKKLKDSGVTAPVSEWSADWQKSFGDGTIVSQLLASWMKMHLKTWTPELAGKWGAALWPEEIREGSESGGGIWVIPAKAEYKDLSGEILTKMYFEKEGAKSYYLATGRIPVLKDAANDAFYALPDPYFGDKPNATQFKALETLKIYPYTPASSQELKIVVQYLNEYMNGNLTVDQALAKAEKDLKNQIGNPYQR